MRSSNGREIMHDYSTQELMIIAAAQSGVDVLQPSFVCAIETAVERIGIDYD